MPPDFGSLWTILTSLGVPIIGVIVSFIWNGRRQDRIAQEDQRQKDKLAYEAALATTKADLVTLRVHVAENYVTILRFQQFEQSIMDTMKRLENKVDQILIKSGGE